MYKIIVIDDEPMITSTLRALIEMMLDYTVYTFNDPLELLESDHVKNEKIDLIISDFIMPQMNGLDLLAEVKKHQPNIVTILLTGYSDKESAIQSINDLGLYYYLEKPWDNNELIKIIRNGIEKATLENELKSKLVLIEKKNNEIKRLYDLLRRDYNKEMDNVIEMIISLTNVIEAKDAYTDGHTRRVSDLSVAIGQKIGLDEKTLNRLELGAMIHDIGKVSTPETILNKPGRLTPDEFNIMKNHPEDGANIIMPLTPLTEIVPIVLSHHEKLDGSGYPNGLKAEQLTQEVRIVCICDIFDALYSERPYRKALSYDQVKNIMDEEVSANHIDGELVKVLYSLYDEGVINNIYNHYK